VYVYNSKAWALCSKNYRRIRSKLNEMCNRKTRVPAGVKNSSWCVDERTVSTAVRAGGLRMAVFTLQRSAIPMGNL
jgi:hypothetical protein